MTIVLYVEGYTERALSAFLKRWLDEKLSPKVGVSAVRFSGSGDYLSCFAQRARRDLASNQVIGVVGLLDWYGAGLKLPLHSSRDEQYIKGKIEMERQVGDPRFRQHFAVHETEAWLLSDPAIFPAAMRDGLEAASALPETVDLHSPPAKLLKEVYRLHGRE